jgi:hypothetical protein
MGYRFLIWTCAIVPAALLIIEVFAVGQRAFGGDAYNRGGLDTALLNLIGGLPLFALYLGPVYLAFARWRFGSGEDLLPAPYKAFGPLGYRVGFAFAWLGHIVLAAACFVGVLTVSDRTIREGGEGVPWPIGVGVAVHAYVIAALCIELSIRGWKRRKGY